MLSRAPLHCHSFKFPLTSASIQSVKFYHSVNRTVSVSFSPRNRTKDRKLKLLDLAVTFGPVHNLFDHPDKNKYLVDFYDVHTAKRFRDAVTRSLKTVEVSYDTDLLEKNGGRTPGPSTVGRIWGGMSRSVRFEPERPGEVTVEDIRRECERLKLQVARVRDWKTHFEITFYRFRDSLSAVRYPRLDLPGRLNDLPIVDYFEGNRKAEKEINTQRTVVISDFSLSSGYKRLLGAACKDSLVESSRYDRDGHTLMLKFLTSRDMESFWHKWHDPRFWSPLSSTIVSKSPRLDRAHRYHKDLAVKLGVSASFMLEYFPRRDGGRTHTSGPSVDEVICRKFEQDLAPYGNLLSVRSERSSPSSPRRVYVCFADIDAAVRAFNRFHMVVRQHHQAEGGVEYKVFHDFAVSERLQERAIFHTHNLKGHIHTL